MISGYPAAKLGHAGAPITSIQGTRPRGGCGLEGRGCGLGVLGCGGGDDPTEIDLDRQPKRQATPPPEFSPAHRRDLQSSGLPAAYSMEESQPLLGEVLRKGQAWLLVEGSSGANEVIEQGELQLHANGIRFERDSSWGV